MKKILAGLLVFAMIFMMAACGSQDNKSENADGEMQEGVNMSNPWADSDKEGVLEATGFELNAPAGAANIAYSYNSSIGMAQLNYAMDDAMWVYRMQKTDALEDISGIYSEWDYTGDTLVAGMDAMEYSYASEPDSNGNMDCVRVINWYDAQNKVTHSLSALGPDLNGMDMASYAEKLLPEDLYSSFLGLHVNSNDGSDILVEEDGDKLKVNVSIFRLCTLDDGVGTYENGEINFESIDPSGEPIKCRLYYNSGSSLCLEVEESTWEYLPNGTVIDGFDN